MVGSSVRDAGGRGGPTAESAFRILCYRAAGPLAGATITGSTRSSPPPATSCSGATR